MKKFLKTIRFDPSDTQVFEMAAEPDEWAIPGGFMFAGAAETDLVGKSRQAFSNGFLSLEGFGHSTFVSVAEIDDPRIENLTRQLAQNFIERFGAPTPDDALVAAVAEMTFVLDMCGNVAVNSIFTLRRFFDDNGEIREEFRIVDAPGAGLVPGSGRVPHARVWDVVEE